MSFRQDVGVTVHLIPLLVYIVCHGIPKRPGTCLASHEGKMPLRLNDGGYQKRLYPTAPGLGICGLEFSAFGSGFGHLSFALGQEWHGALGICFGFCLGPFA